MQPTPLSTAQSDLLKTMQPQSTQNMYVPSGTNNPGNARSNQQTGPLFRVPPSCPSQRSNARHIPMPMYQPSMPQSVVVSPFAQYTPRQPQYQTQQFSFSSPNYYAFQYYPAIQQPHQRGGVGVNAGVGVGSGLSVQTGPNGPVTAQPGAAQSQIPLQTGAVLTSAVQPVTSTVLGVPNPTTGPALGQMVVPVSSQSTQRPRPRKHAIEIINPDTKKNIFDNSDADISKQATSIPETDCQEQVTSVPVQSEMPIGAAQPDHSAIGINSGVIVMATDARPSLPYTIDLHQIPQQGDIILPQTPVVSAMSDAPSVEILPPSQKPRVKKTLPKEDLPIPQAPSIYEEPKQQQVDALHTVRNFDDVPQAIAPPSIDYVNQDQQVLQLTEHYQNPQVEYNTTQEATNLENFTSDESYIVADSTNTSVQTVAKSETSALSTANTVVTSPIDTDTISTRPIEDPATSLADSESSHLKDSYTASVVETSYCNMQLNNKETTTAATTTSNEESSVDTAQAPVAAASTTANGVQSTLKTDKNKSMLSKNNAETSTNPASDTYDETDRATFSNSPTATDESVTVEDASIVTDGSFTSKSEPKSFPTAAAVQNVVSTSTAVLPEMQSLINYNEGQWSPNNPTGKKQYDREQLLQLREAKASRIQPEVSNTSILPQPNQPNLMPAFVLKNNKRVQSMVGSIGGNRSGADSGNSNYGKQASMSGVNSRNSMKGGMINLNLSLNQDVKLNEADNAWRPRVLGKGSDESNPEARAQREKEDLVRRVRGILNKLTPEKFDTLVEEIIKLKIDTPDKMEEVIVLVFEKAIDEPNFSVSYARLCQRLILEVKAQDERMESGTKMNLSRFRIALIDKTEREFTQNVTQTSAKDMRLQPIVDKIKKCTDPAEKAELEALLEEEERKIRRRSGGTVRFIGELFKISMLTGKIIASCIDALLKANKEDQLECMCKLITTVGMKFEQTKDTNDTSHCYSLEKTIARMQAIASKTDKAVKVSSRVRFMLQDVIDLRKNKWQTSRNEAPKTMEQIEKETKNEQMSSMIFQYANKSGPGSSGVGSGGSQVGAGKRDYRGGGGSSGGGGGNRFGDNRSGGGYGGNSRGDGGSMRRQQQGGNSNNSNSSGTHSNGNNDENTWHVQTSKGSRSLDASKLGGLGLATQNMEAKKMGGVSQFTWIASTLRQTSSQLTTGPTNPFAALSLPDPNKVSDRDRDRDRDRSGPRNKGSYNKGSMERDRYDRASSPSSRYKMGMQSRTGSSQASRENSSSRGSQSGRNMNTPSSVSSSHSKYQQHMPVSRLSGKSSGLMPAYGQRNESGNASSYSTQMQLPADTHSRAPPTAVFEEPRDGDLKLIKSVVSELVENTANSKTISTSVLFCVNKISERQRCGLLYYILTDYLYLRDVSQTYRRYLGNIVAFLIKQNFLSLDHFRLSYEQFCEIASDLELDIPDLWLYVFEFTGPLIAKKVITLKDLWHEKLRQDDSNLGTKFLKTFLLCCTREIGPSFTRNMWKNSEVKWKHFMPESDVEKFIANNKLGYIENESLQPEIDSREPKETRVKRVIDHIEHLLKEGSNADAIIDYVNGNVAEVDKYFIRTLTTTLCDFAITYKDGSYKLTPDVFQKACIPVLHRYIDSKEERELECLSSMQLLVHGLEHPRGLLNELFAELYDADVIPQDSFIKWRDSKDQSHGKGVAVKGLNPFFNHVLSIETSEDEDDN